MNYKIILAATLFLSLPYAQIVDATYKNDSPEQAYRLQKEATKLKQLLTQKLLKKIERNLDKVKKIEDLNKLAPIVQEVEELLQQLT